MAERPRPQVVRPPSDAELEAFYRKLAAWMADVVRNGKSARRRAA